MDLLKNNVRFSFKLDGTDSRELEYVAETEEKGDELVTVYSFSCGLRITNKAKKISGYDAYEWVNYLENTADAPTGIISELWDCDVTLPMPHEDPRKWQSKFPDPKRATVVVAPSGSNWTHLEFYCETEKFDNNNRVNHIYVGKTKNTPLRADAQAREAHPSSTSIRREQDTFSPWAGRVNGTPR